MKPSPSLEISSADELEINPEHTPGQVLITAHRGYGVNAKHRDDLLQGATFYPENSLAAFKAAIKDHAHALELDVHVSVDGTAMVIHGDKIASYAEINKHSLPNADQKLGQKF